MKSFKKLMVFLMTIALLVSSISTFAVAVGNGDYAIYKVVSGDSLWKVSDKFRTTIQSIRDFNGLTSDQLFIGQNLKVPVIDISNVPRPIDIVHAVVSGDSFWNLSVAYKTSINDILTKNGLTSSSVIYPGQKLIIPLPVIAPPPVNTAPYVTYTSYYVQSGETAWDISIKFSIPMTELLKVNGLTTSSMLSLNQKLSIPVHHIPVTPTNGPQYGEYLDWWTQAQYVLPIGKVAKITDFYTGKSWYIKRTIGAGHADVETVTAQDTSIMKGVWGGTWSWISRPVIVEVGGRRIAASMAGMPHAGVDSAPAGQTVASRSDDYGTGPNLDYVKGNNMNGHVDIHFLNSVTHNTGLMTPSMQANVKIAAGVK